MEALNTQSIDFGLIIILLYEDNWYLLDVTSAFLQRQALEASSRICCWIIAKTSHLSSMLTGNIFETEIFFRRSLRSTVKAHAIVILVMLLPHISMTWNGGALDIGSDFVEVAEAHIERKNNHYVRQIIMMRVLMYLMIYADWKKYVSSLSEW